MPRHLFGRSFFFFCEGGGVTGCFEQWWLSHTFARSAKPHKSGVECTFFRSYSKQHSSRTPNENRNSRHGYRQHLQGKQDKLPFNGIKNLISIEENQSTSASPLSIDIHLTPQHCVPPPLPSLTDRNQRHPHQKEVLSAS